MLCGKNGDPNIILMTGDDGGGGAGAGNQPAGPESTSDASKHWNWIEDKLKEANE